MILFHAPGLARPGHGGGIMIDTWKDAFTIVGGFAATALAVVTISKSNSSKIDMNISKEEKTALSESVYKLLQYYNDLKLAVLELRKDTDHLSEKISDLAVRADRDHNEVKKLTLILYPLIKDEIAEQRKKLGIYDSER